VIAANLLFLDQNFNSIRLDDGFSLFDQMQFPSRVSDRLKGICFRMLQLLPPLLLL